MNYRKTAALLTAGTALAASWTFPIAAQTAPVTAPSSEAPAAQPDAGRISETSASGRPVT